MTATVERFARRRRLGRRRLLGSDFAAGAKHHRCDMDATLLDVQARTIRRHEVAERLDTTRAWALIRAHYAIRQRLGAVCSPIDDLELRYDDMTDAALRRGVARLARTLRAQQRWDA